jgi:hypothetical protein
MNCSDSRHLSTFFCIQCGESRSPSVYGKQTFFFISSDTLPSSVLVAPQRSWAGLSGLRHLRDGLRIRLGDHAPCAKAACVGGSSGPIEEPVRARSVESSPRSRHMAGGAQRNDRRVRGLGLLRYYLFVSGQRDQREVFAIHVVHQVKHARKTGAGVPGLVP